MTPKIGLNLERNYSINFDLPERDKKLIKFIIIHYTGMKLESKALKKLLNPNSKVSAHYFIKNNGTIVNMVPDEYIAWHAGVSNWKNFKSLNKYSIGIEISNPGHNHGYKNFSPKQISSLIKLLKIFIQEYKIKRKNILGHSDIAPLRKKDPGEKFPWKKLGKKKVSFWHKLNEEKTKIFRGKKLSLIEKKLFLKNLYRFGYCKIKEKNIHQNVNYLTKAFQRRFRQDLINGKVDKECFLISKSLIKR
ncbi:N-acetylmuramoyl-L-alanine amidase [Candidatus Pelagibacter sp.]|nr:N-acetylmuramoyl-L-alanine amidase [Candidatus Pelagibacter sp.]MDC3089866.1 N-acetylmuramoyl-L-alanine amidase [Candidatus Pelagibacter sp.]